MKTSLLHLNDEVAAALREGRAVVALESTIITHGMPYPANLETARGVETVVRENGAVPATIAVVAGKIKVGLDDTELEKLAAAKDVVKASGRDLAAIMVGGGSAGTTVSATMRIAALAGIGIFATGGVGGVHRGAEATFDISADLTELGQTGTTVVCAGVKSILDIAKTLEYLETQRVPVIAYQSDDFPAFYTRSSGLKADHRLDTPEDIAGAMLLHEQIGSGTGILVANPIPEVDALDPAFIDGTIAAAVAEAEKRGIGRKELTPFLLARINELSQGRSLKANIALVRNNAELAARIAVAHARLKRMAA
ncbi:MULTISPECIES: pseudouridine-5'-phosphate glycosidase [unclassified Mesorhizobium]|uniref:pseudouridine-5'-phosphate glycosidase n=1 Tax=unclassified Mesorhizobium TaxID=325217 RepID=UPI000FCC5AF9|nr:MULTISPECIES: pseudouridine-5'-phosphate glycosidase [unclassified Mesorhizobium]RUU47118.1 pseudouridine-5'-phosphate glycosidase [Mesorhizobium sp. M6A.T.Ce.TU.002.03.1.1]RVB73433.1 pseudouridine-5'-phosphate glycosidase [Mesorhizobium sp. M6A.T.Cr.TU.014.01.1.1]RWP74024.1 MAG: pseudouridine-5'-phosphate glycosidase [Mesorhizobium sp.]RWP97340.1 MAG: pseudouridine-5'-phosphate glycosidase [Mesorhizobium sp.]RWQ00537.1 MAG: pseudouridine-5'-phosphate glycosidase [Mesorhizobium sp.]